MIIFDCSRSADSQSVVSWHWAIGNRLKESGKAVNLSLLEKWKFDNRRASPFWESAQKNSCELRKSKDDYPHGLFFHPPFCGNGVILMLDVSYFGDEWFFWGRWWGWCSGANSYTQHTSTCFTICKNQAGCFDGLFCVFMCSPQSCFSFGDCDVVPNPSSEQ